MASVTESHPTEWSSSSTSGTEDASKIELAPGNLVAEAQLALARKDFNGASEKFTELIEKTPPGTNLALAYMSRSLCQWERRDYQKSLDDAMKAHEEYDDVVMPSEIIHGAFNTKAASAFQIAKCHQQLGNGGAQVNKYQKAGTDLLRVTAANYEKALTLKDEGNDYFKRGWMELALSKYEEALKLDPTNAPIMTNICQALLKMNRLDQATDIASRCVETKPDWAKGWYRKGMVAMKKRHHADAVASFQKALACPNIGDDELSDIKSAYMQAASTAEKTNKVKGGFDKQYMGMMMQMRASSWNIYEWYSKSRKDANIWMLRDWDAVVAPKLNSDRELGEICDRALATKFTTMKKGSLPMDVLKWQEGAAPPRTSVAAFTIPITPLVSLVIMHYILSKAYPTKKWSMVWTFQADPVLFTQSVLSPHISHHRTYASIISKDSKIIVDILALWAYGAGGDNEPQKTCWLDDVIKAGLESSKQNADNDDPKLRNQPWTFYTCDDPAAFLEFIEAGAKVERAESEFVKIEDAKRKKDAEEKKNKLDAEREARRLAERQKLVEEARAARLARGESLPSENSNISSENKKDGVTASSSSSAPSGSGPNGDGGPPTDEFKVPFDVSQTTTNVSNNMYYIGMLVASILVVLVATYYRNTMTSSPLAAGDDDGRQ